MRIDLILQRLHAGMQKQAFLLFQLDLNADAVKDLELNPNGHRRGGINRHLNPQVAAVHAEDGMRKISRHLRLYETQTDDRGEEHDLPVEQARGRQVAANQAIDAEIDKRGERPDIIFIKRHGAQLAGDETTEYSEGERGPFAVHKRGQGHQHAAQDSGPASANHSQQQRSFEAQVSGNEAVHGKSNPGADHDRQTEPRYQVSL